MTQAIKQVPAFAASFANIMLFWYAHHRWGRRFGLENGGAIVPDRKLILPFRMKISVTWLVLAAWLLPVIAGADQPAKGKLLVATEVVQGEVFAETVILLLHYDEHGAMGIVVNRPTDVELQEVLADVEVFSAYHGTLFWGGPVRMHSLRALLRADSPPEGAEAIVGSVYQVPINDDLKGRADPDRLRFYIGYAGWSAGQLDREMARGSWHVVAASDERVFSKDPRALWKQLSPPREHRAATQAAYALML